MERGGEGEEEGRGGEGGGAIIMWSVGSERANLDNGMCLYGKDCV